MAKVLRWQPGFDRNFLLKQIADCRKIDNGKCSFHGSDYQFWLPVLKSAVQASSGISPHQKSLAISSAISDAAVSLKDADQFIERCNRAFQNILNRPKQKFVLLCHITYSGPSLFGSIRVGDCQIRWQPNAKSRFLVKATKEREEKLKLRLRRLVPSDPARLTALLIDVEAYSPADAHEQASSAVDRLRGLLNLIINRRRSLSFFRTTSPHAVNSVRLGPYRTLHKPNGELATETFWYEPRWTHEKASARIKDEDRKTIKAGIRRWWTRTLSNPLRDLIHDGLQRYCRALDQHDTDATLLGLWSTLEALTGTQNARYDTTIDRVICLFKDSAEARLIAQHIRLHRNATAHSARSPSSDEVDTIIYHAEMLVEQILFFCIENGNKFKTQNELWEFLDLPLDHDSLRRHKKLIDHFIEYRTIS